MTQERERNQFKTTTLPASSRLVNTYYGLLGLHPAASAIAIRRSYRHLSKKYHPDTTELPKSIAKAKFQRLNEAYATLSNPEQRYLYDLKIGYSRINVIQAPNWSQPNSETWSNSSYLDPTDRPLSSGEIFVLLLLGVTFVGCLVLVLTISYLQNSPVA